MLASVHLTLYHCHCIYMPPHAVIYDTPSDVVAGVGPDTSENVAYGVTQTVLTTPNPAYDVVQI